MDFKKTKFMKISDLIEIRKEEYITLQLIPVVEPSTANNKTLKMTSGDTSIFKVTNGTVTCEN